VDLTQTFIRRRLGKLAKEFFLQAQALTTIFFFQHDLPIHKCLLCNLAFGCACEYFRVVHALAPFFLAPMSFDTTLDLITLHLKLDGYFSLCLEDYELDKDLELFSDSFKLAFQCMSHLLASGHSKIFLIIFEIIFTLKI
jgi:hypothetical protein